MRALALRTTTNPGQTGHESGTGIGPFGLTVQDKRGNTTNCGRGHSAARE